MRAIYTEGHTLSAKDPTFFVCRAGYPWAKIKAPDRHVACALYMERCELELAILNEDEWFFVHREGSPMMEKVRAYPVIHTRSHEMWFEGEWRAKFAKQYGEVPT